MVLWLLVIRGRIRALRLQVLAYLHIIGALARRMCLRGLDLFPGRLVPADFRAVHAAVHGVGRDQPAVVVPGDIFVSFRVEAVAIRRLGDRFRIYSEALP